MPKYKDYDDWLAQQQTRNLKFKTEIQNQLPENILNEPLDYPLRKVQDTPEPTEGWVDKNPLYDFVGNVLWGAAETFMVPTVLDIAGEAAGAGDLSAAFGSQDWKDESWAGRAGYMLGTAGGILTGIGAVGKGLGAASKAFGAGTKIAATKLAKESGTHITDDIATSLIKSTRTNIKEAAKTAKSGINFFEFSAKKALKRNPLGDALVKDGVQKNVRNELIEKLGMKADDDALEALTKSVMTESAESMNKHFGHSIGYQLKQRGWNPKVAQVAGDVVYEAALLGTWDTVVGEVADKFAESNKLDESQWGYDDWYHRAAHGMLIGSVLAPIRYIKGGKAVAFGKSGMVADMGHMRRFIAGRYKNPKNMSDNQLKAFANSLFVSSGNSVKMFAGVRDLSESFLKETAGKTLTAPQREIYENAFNAVKGELPRLVKKLGGEMLRDGKESFLRASVGSLAMNAGAYKQAYDHGILFTEDYPIDKLIADHWVGMLYMKRGKTIEGKPAMPRFFDQTGMDANGGEIAKMINSMNILGRDETTLELYNRFSNNSLEDALTNTQEKSIIANDLDARQVVEKVRTEFIDGQEYIQRIQSNPDLQGWAVQVRTEVSERKAKIKDLKSQGKIQEAEALEVGTNKLQDSFLLAEELSNMALFGYQGTTVRPMERQEAIDFVENLGKIRLSDGMLLTTENFDILENRIEEAKLKVTEQIQSLGIDYITKSLDAFGLIDLSASKDGRLLLNRSIKDALYTLRAYSEKNPTTKELERPYYDQAATLIEAIENAKKAGIIELGDAGLPYRAQDIMNPDNLKKFVQIHKDNTELLHEIVFNSTSPESSWREKMPGWTDKEGFFDEGIIGRTPIWHSIQTANRFKRNQLTYEAFTNRDSDLYNKIFPKLNGKEIFKVVTKDIEAGTEVPADLTPEQATFHHNLNSLFKLLGKEGRIGSEAINVSELDKISKDVFEEFGNVISDAAEFTAFNHYLYKNLINDLTGNSKITVSMRKVIAQGLAPESLLTIRKDGGLVFRSAKALRTSLTARQDITEPQRKNLNEMINRYEAEIEIPLQDALKSGGMIRFENKPLDPKLPGNEVSELTQNMQEALNQVNKFSMIEIGDLGKTLNDLSSITNDISESLNTDMVDSKSLRQAVMDFSNSGKSLVELLNIYIGNKDVIGIRHILDSMEKIDVLNRDISSSKPTDAKSIIEYRRILEKYVDDAIRKRNETLQIDDIDQLDSFISEKVYRISRSDRSNRPHQGNTSISVNQYESKWNLPTDFATNLTENPRKIMEFFDLLVDPDIARASVFAREILQTGTNAVISGKYTPKQYIDTVVEPIIKNAWAKIEKATLKGKEAPGTYEEFVLDTYYLVQSALSGKKIPIFTFENGMGNISETTISNWDVGLNKLSRLLGLKEPGSIMLFGSRVGAERGFTSNVTEQLREEMFSMIESGVMVNLNTKDVLRASDVAILDKYHSLLEGRGKDSGTEFIPVQLDEKTLIVIPAAKAESIARAWSSRESDLRKDLVAVQNSTIDNPAKAREMVESYLERELNAKFNDAGEMTIELNNSNIQKLVMTTRLLEAFPHIVPEVMNNTVSVMDGLSTLKYIKMDSPKGGMALNERTLNVAKEFLPRFIEDGSNIQKAYDVFKNHYFDSEGNPTKHRTINIFDEKGDGRGYFDSSKIGRKLLTDQMAANNPKLDPSTLADRVDTIMEGYEKVAASVQNGEKYLSLPEMTSMLVAKGARKDWFVWDDAGNVIGFNVALKPIEMYSKIDRDTGEIVVSVGKTAYKYHPKFDNMMKVDGEYFTDSIGFESTHKVHKKYNPETKKWESPGIAMNFDTVSDWQGSMKISRQQGESQRLEMDRGAIFIKSVSGIHDATVSFGFSNLMSNTAQRHLNNVTGINKVVKGMTGAYSALAENPFAYKDVVQQLIGWQGESGDAIGRITGIESVLSVNGLPLFEFMIPQIDRMITSEYMGTRNLTSSSVENGSHSVMTAGSNLSAPERRENIQFTFGGSGISHSEWDKPILKLLAKDGAEGLSFVFKATPHLIKKFGLGQYIEAGNDILVTHDGEVMSPHLAKKYDIKESKVRRKLDAFEKGMQGYHEEIIQLIKENPSIRSLGDAALFLNGTLSMREVLDMDHNLTNKLGTTPSKAAIYNKIKEGDNPLFQSIHLGKVDLRTPKAGLNDWVITRIEKLIDRRRGPVSEMNLFDVIDPQDADFDLDKSSSLFALPGKVIKEVYNVSGYFSPAEDAFDKVLQDVILTENIDVSRHRDVLAAIEKKRPSLIRQQSILSSLLQYFSTVPDKIGNDIFVPGDSRNQMFNRGRQRGFFVAEVRANNKDYRISLREGAELADSMGFMKNLIKATIDIYKGTQSVETRDLDKLMWSHPEFGLLKVTDSNDPGRSLPWETLPSKTRNTLDNFVKGILNPIADIYNLNRMTDNFTDGTSRKMTAFEMVYKYDQALTNIRYAGYHGEKELEALSLGLVRFLGGNKFSGNAGPGGMSEQPLIKALSALRKGMNKHFASIPHDSGLAEIMSGVSREKDALRNAIAGIVADEKSMAQISAVQYRLEQIGDVISGLKASRRLDSSAGRYWEKQLKIHEELINEFNKQINDPKTVFEKNEEVNVKRSSGSSIAQNVTRFYRKIGEEVKVVNQFNKGEKMFWKKGDVFVENPKTFVAGSDTINRVRKAMHDAFDRIDHNITDNEYQIIEYQYGKFQESIRNLEKFVDPDAPRTSDRMGLRSEAELRVLAEHLTTVGGITTGKSNDLQRQFLYRLLVPDAAKNIFDITGWDPVDKKRRLSPHFNQNKQNEKMVFKFLQRAMERNAEMIVSSENATEWYQAINDRFKAAFVKQYSPTLDVSVFNFERTSRTAADFSLLPKLDQLPKFVYDSNLNEKAKNVLQSYLNGTYFLDPIETYRLSVDLKAKTFEGAPNMESIGSQIEYMWEGTDNIQLGNGAWYKAAHTFRSQTYHSLNKKAPESALEGHRRILKGCLGG